MMSELTAKYYFVSGECDGAGDPPRKNMTGKDLSGGNWCCARKWRAARQC